MTSTMPSDYLPAARVREDKLPSPWMIAGTRGVNEYAPQAVIAL